jgi:hypothetical protein
VAIDLFERKGDISGVAMARRILDGIGA